MTSQKKDSTLKDSATDHTRVLNSFGTRLYSSSLCIVLTEGLEWWCKLLFILEYNINRNHVNKQQNKYYILSPAYDFGEKIESKFVDKWLDFELSTSGHKSKLKSMLKS